MTFKGQNDTDQWESRAIYRGKLILWDKNWDSYHVWEKSKVWETKNGLFHRTAPSCIRRLLFKLGEAWGIRESTARPRISDIASSLRLPDEIDITIISALSPHRPTFKEKCHPFHTFQCSIMQAGRQASSIQRYRRSFFSLFTRQTPAREAPLQRYKLDLAPVCASSQMLCVAA